MKTAVILRYLLCVNSTVSYFCYQMYGWQQAETCCHPVCLFIFLFQILLDLG